MASRITSRPLRSLVLLFGLLNASLYSAILPLWEGFDEAFHYAYVESLWQTAQFPVLGKALVPADVAGSFLYAPVSHIVHRWIAESTPFDVWYALPLPEKQQRRQQLEALRPDARLSTRPNYEAHQPPLAYLCLALFDAPLSGASITTRVLLLRLVASFSAMILLYLGVTSLCKTLALPPAWTDAALFTVFCSQMLYATVAHVANDWLAIGASAMLLAALVRQSAWHTAIWLTIGLLTKAYFLVFVVLAIGVLLRRGRIPWKQAVIVLLLAGPWYARNLVLYKNVSGTHEQFNGIGVREALAAAPRIDWLSTAGFLARGSLWTGNNSFTTFSRATLGLVLLLLLVAVAAWAYYRRGRRAIEWVLIAALGLFSVAIAYATCASFADTKGDVPGASPWYSQVLLAPVVVLAYLGLSRWPRVGAYLAASTLALWTWVLTATWVIKLFPMYAGGITTPMRLRETWTWYRHQASTTDLSLLALASAPVLYVGLAVVVLLTISLGGIMIRRVLRPLHADLE